MYKSYFLALIAFGSRAWSVPVDPVGTVASGFAIYSGVSDVIHRIFDNFRGSEEQFTQATVASLSQQYPGKNVLVYHTQQGKGTFNGVALHDHYELQLSRVQTWGFDIWVFDSGVFDLSGDGGYIAWCFAGNFKRNYHHVEFSPNKAGTKVKRDNSTQPAAQPLLPPAVPVRQSAEHKHGHYLVDCHDTHGVQSSGIAFYNTLSPGGNVGQQPDDYASVSTGHLASWGAPRTVAFPGKGDSVHLSPFGNADTAAAVNGTAGLLTSGDEHRWIYKDNGRLLYSTNGTDCHARFWAF